MRKRKLRLALLALAISYLWFATECGGQTTDPKIIVAAKKEGGEIEAYVTLRTDTAQTVWKMFETKYSFLKVKQ